jgi:hypothetical protein
MIDAEFLFAPSEVEGRPHRIARLDCARHERLF